MRLIDADALLQTLNESDITFNAYINEAIMNAPTVNQWTPVEEALPNDDNDYLVMDDEGVCAVGWYRHDAKAWDSCEFGWLENRNDPPYGIGTVVAWMPLPEPYKAESEENK